MALRTLTHSARDRLALAWLAIRGKLALDADDSEDWEYEDESEPESELPKFVGPIRKVSCKTDEFERIYARPMVGGPYGPSVRVTIEIDGSDQPRAVLLSVRDARAFGAGLIDAADEASGETTIVFAMPGDAEEANEGAEMARTREGEING